MRQGVLFPDPAADASGTVVYSVPDAELWLDCGFLERARADRLYAVLRSDTDWTQESMVLYGREVAVPRLSAWHGDPQGSYAYSGIRHDPLPWTPVLQELRAAVERRTGCGFNSVLLNWYRDGKDSVSWHADDERELGEHPRIASLSLGAARTFQLKHRTRPELGRLDIELMAGSLLWMGGRCQRCWLHQVPKRRGLTEGRINLTFRSVRGAAS